MSEEKKWWEGPELREPLVLLSRLAEAWEEGFEAGHGSPREDVDYPDLPDNPYLVTP